MRLLLGDMLLYEMYNLQWNVLQMSEMITFLVLKHWDVLFPCVCVQGFPCSVTKSCQTLCYYMDCSMLGFLSFTISQSLHKLMSTESVIPSNHLILCCPFSLGLSLSHHQCFPMSWLNTSGVQNIWASTPVLPMKKVHTDKTICASDDRESGRNEGNGYPCHYSCLGNPMDRGAWWARAHVTVKKSDTN